MSRHIGAWSTDLEPRIVDSVSKFKLRGSRLPVADPGVTGAGCRIWSELVCGVGLGLAGACGSDLGALMFGLDQSRVVLFGLTVS